MFICPPTPTHSELGFVEQTLFNRDRFFNFTSCKISQTCAHQPDSFFWLFNCLTLLQSSLSLCSWPAYGDHFQFPGWPSGSVFGSLSLSCSLWLSQELSGSGFLSYFSFKSLLGLQGVCSARAASLFVGLVLFLSFQGSLCLTVCVCIGKSGIALHSEPVFTNLTWSSRV